MKFPRLILSVALLAMVMPAQAMNFTEAYQLALQHDAQWLAAQQEAKAAFQDRNISRANLLPNISYNYRRNKNDSDIEVDRQGLSATQHRNYDSYFSALVLRQPIFDLAAIRQYNQAGLSSKMAEWNLLKNKQQLSVRLLQAYLDILMSQEEVQLGQAQLQALSSEEERLSQLFKYGEATRTDQLEVQSRYQLAQAELIYSQNQYDARLRVLEAMTGSSLTMSNGIDGLSETAFKEFKSKAFMDKADLSQWSQLAERHNAELATKQTAYEVAKMQVKRLNADYYPKVNAFAQKQVSSSNTENTLGEKYDTDSVGIEVSFPVFNGGYTLASVKQARARAEQARYEWVDMQKTVSNELRRQYLNLTSSQQRILAYEQAVHSADAQLEATRYSMQGGERTHLDVLNAQQQYYRTLKDLAQANYDFLQAWQALRWQAGILNQSDIELLAQCFQPSAHPASH
ncbi:TolC family outer membrane protein [Acinetobacter sp. WZC-1]|uniref:TolC family outer membrane protein n=1 Tax=Acinetobacter sp. WZC-1 TaxID=3459034 RepID=UPI00403E33C7